MRILAIYRHYWPDTTPYARLLRAILEHLVHDGHAATVFTAQPSYNDVEQPRQPRREQLGDVDIHRMQLLPEKKRWKALRVANFLIFLFRATLHVLWNRKQYDLIIANTHPPVLMGVVLRLIRQLTGIRFLLHCQDVHPESAVLAGQVKTGTLAKHLIRMDVKSCLAAAKVVTLSQDMREVLLHRPGYDVDNIAIINNFPLSRYHEASKVPAVFGDCDDPPFRVLFAGNMGLFQNLDRLMSAAKLLAGERRIHFIFMGAGAMTQSLQQQAGDLLGRTVFFEPFQPVETAFACMRRADLGVASLASGVYRVAYPSKTMTYLAAGCPILVLVERKSCLAEEVVANKFGYVPDSNEPTDIAETIRSAWQARRTWTPSERASLAERSDALFGCSRALCQWSLLIDALDAHRLPRQRNLENTNRNRQAA